MLRRFQLILTVSLISLLATACMNNRGQLLPTPDASFYTVDPVFREFYNVLGGEAVLGKVISPAEEENGITYQYTMTGKLTFDPQRPPAQKFQLAPLGTALNLGGEPKSGEVAGVFRAAYDQLKGATFVGEPLTDLIYNAEKGCSEQYFENLGFYQGPETGGDVRLLPYGAWACGDACLDSLPSDAAPLDATPTHQATTPAKLAATALAQTSIQPYRWTIQAWESMPMVKTTQGQEIKINVQRDGAPLEGAQALLVVELPDGSQRKESFPATGADGNSRLKVDPIQAENGTVIPYQVCITSDHSDTYCLRQSYMVWSKP
jgi:hypothetical protein